MSKVTTVEINLIDGKSVKARVVDTDVIAQILDFKMDCGSFLVNDLDGHRVLIDSNHITSAHELEVHNE